MDDAVSVPKELDQVLDQVGVVEMNRCHLPQARPGVAAAGRSSHCGSVAPNVKALSEGSDVLLHLRCGVLASISG